MYIYIYITPWGGGHRAPGPPSRPRCAVGERSASWGSNPPTRHDCPCLGFIADDIAGTPTSTPTPSPSPGPSPQFQGATSLRRPLSRATAATFLTASLARSRSCSRCSSTTWSSPSSWSTPSPSTSCTARSAARAAFVDVVYSPATSPRVLAAGPRQDCPGGIDLAQCSPDLASRTHFVFFCKINKRA